jgi:TatD DNase family protein
LALVDSHAHLDRREYAEDLEAVVARAKAAGLSRVVNIGLWRAPGDFGDALALAEKEPAYFAATIGVHPHESVDVPEADWATLEELAHDPRIVAVGETGLDFHYDHSPREVQEAAFRRSVRIAKAARKPLVIHLREADEVCATVLEEEGLPEAGGVMHCFTGGRARAERWLAMGLHLSIAGVVTFKNADELREAVRHAPKDRVMVETDCPFLAPIPFRGKRNEPAYVAHVAAKVAELWGVSVEEAGEITSANARRFFGLDAR